MCSPCILWCVHMYFMVGAPCTLWCVHHVLVSGCTMYLLVGAPCTLRCVRHVLWGVCTCILVSGCSIKIKYPRFKTNNVFHFKTARLTCKNLLIKTCIPQFFKWADLNISIVKNNFTKILICLQQSRNYCKVMQIWMKIYNRCAVIMHDLCITSFCITKKLTFNSKFKF